MVKKEDLVLELCATPRASVGYGVVYACEVRRVIRGTLAQEKIFLTILASDHDVEAAFAARKAPQVIEAAFKRKRAREPYRLMPITGFVDDDRTSWELVSIR